MCITVSIEAMCAPARKRIGRSLAAMSAQKTWVETRSVKLGRGKVKNVSCRILHYKAALEFLKGWEGQPCSQICLSGRECAISQMGHIEELCVHLSDVLPINSTPQWMLSVPEPSGDCVDRKILSVGLILWREGQVLQIPARHHPQLSASSWSMTIR